MRKLHHKATAAARQESAGDELKRMLFLELNHNGTSLIFQKTTKLPCCKAEHLQRVSQPLSLSFSLSPENPELAQRSNSVSNAREDLQLLEH